MYNKKINLKYNSQRSAPVGYHDDCGRTSITPTPRGDNTSPAKPEAVVHAMKVCFHIVLECQYCFLIKRKRNDPKSL